MSPHSGQTQRYAVLNIRRYLAQQPPSRKVVLLGHEPAQARDEILLVHRREGPPIDLELKEPSRLGGGGALPVSPAEIQAH